MTTLLDQISTLNDLPSTLDGPVLVRVDYNVPLKDGKVADTFRLEMSLPTIHTLLRRGAPIILMSHLGRPKGKVVPGLSLRPVAESLSQLLEEKLSSATPSCDPPQVHFTPQVLGEEVSARARELSPGEILLLENLRFHPGERANDEEFARQLASLAAGYVNDAFSACHRAHASVVGVPQYLPAFAGHQLVREVEALGRVVEEPARPFAVVLGGAKIADKLPVIQRLVELADLLLVGGGIANTMLAARGHSLGSSLVEEEMVEEAGKIIQQCLSSHTRLVLPQDLVIAGSPQSTEMEILEGVEVPEGMMALDLGPQTINLYQRHLRSARTVFWNGPLGYAENPLFAGATRALTLELHALHETEVVVGGGDTVSAVREVLKSHPELRKGFFLSTGGGASLEFMAGRELPGLSALTGEGN